MIKYYKIFLAAWLVTTVIVVGWRLLPEPAERGYKIDDDVFVITQDVQPNASNRVVFPDSESETLARVSVSPELAPYGQELRVTNERTKDSVVVGSERDGDVYQGKLSIRPGDQLTIEVLQGPVKTLPALEPAINARRVDATNEN